MNLSKYLEATNEVAVSLRPKAHHGENIKHFRVARGFSQEYLAEKLGISQVKLCRLEKKETVDDEYLNSISKLLGVDVIWLSDIPLTVCVSSTSLSAKGNYFQNGGHATSNYTIQFPVEVVIDSLNQAAQRVEENYKHLLKEKDKLIAQKDELIKIEREAREAILSRISRLIMDRFDTDKKSKNGQ